MRRTDVAASALILLIGAGQIVATAFLSASLGNAAVWFLGSGFALLLLGFLNWLRLSAPSPLSRQLCATANLLGLAWVIFTVWVVRVPQGYLAIGILAVATVASLADCSRD